MAQSDAGSELETVAILNTILRHHVRNHLMVIRGRAQWLGRSSPDEDVETIVRRCDELAETVDRIEAVTNSLTSTPQTDCFDVAAFLRSEIGRLRQLYDADLTLSTEDSEETVVGDELFSFVLREMIDNAIVYADSDTPTVTISLSGNAETVVLTVWTEDGDGIPAGLSTDPFAASGGAGTAGPEYGLSLSQAIVDRYDGSVSIDEGSTGEMQLRVRLPRD